MDERTRVALFGKGVRFRIKRATFSTGLQSTITFNANLLRNKKTVVVPDGVYPYPYKRGVVWLVDLDTSAVVGIGKNIGTLGEKVELKIDLMNQNKFWRFVGGRALDLIETLILMGAGYGWIRLVEVLIVQLFGK